MASRRRIRKLRLVGITDDDLMENAGPGAYERGYDYYREGRVGSLEVCGTQTVALVSGTDLYRVELRHDPVKVGIFRSIHHTHPASTNLGNDFIGSDRGARFETHELVHHRSPILAVTSYGPRRVPGSKGMTQVG